LSTGGCFRRPQARPSRPAPSNNRLSGPLWASTIFSYRRRHPRSASLSTPRATITALLRRLLLSLTSLCLAFSRSNAGRALCTLGSAVLDGAMSSHRSMPPSPRGYRRAQMSNPLGASDVLVSSLLLPLLPRQGSCAEPCNARHETRYAMLHEVMSIEHPPIQHGPEFHRFSDLLYSLLSYKFPWISVFSTACFLASVF